MSRRRIASVSSELYFDGASGVSVMYLYGCMGQWGMANRTAPALVLREGDRGELERLTRAATVMASTAQRARIVLLAADGVESRTPDIAAGLVAEFPYGPADVARGGRSGRCLA
jgi:hypothetical protein